MTAIPTSVVTQQDDARPLTLSVADFERATGLSHSKVYELLASGALKSFTVGRRRLIPYSAVQDWIDAGLRESDRR